MEIRTYIEQLAQRSKKASFALRSVPAIHKNRALSAIAGFLDGSRNRIQEANAEDLRRGKSSGLSAAMLDRLALDTKRIDAMIQSVREIAAFEDPVGEVIGVKRPQGFILEKVRVPIGVIAVIYESRPNVTIDAAALCLKSGNGVILRGGSEAYESNRVLTEIVREGLESADLPQDSVCFVESKAHESVNWLVKQENSVDLVIPRGGESLIRAVVREATIPVIKHYKGVCHLYIDEDADLDMAVNVVHNAKVQRPGTCNALETLLVHVNVSERFLPMMGEKLKDVELRGCERTRKIFTGVKAATEEDYYAEFLDLILAVRVVDSMDEAIAHIETYGSKHTDGIITRDVKKAQKFSELVDSAVVTINASTRLSDGGTHGCQGPDVRQMGCAGKRPSSDSLNPPGFLHLHAR